MRHAISVGMGFGKKNFSDAILSSHTGDTIVLDPGQYDVPGGFTIGANIKIRGNGANPEDVVLNTTFVLKEGIVLKIENLFMHNPDSENRNLINLKNEAQVIAEGTIFDVDESKYPAFWVSHGTLALTASEVRTNGITEGIYAQSGSYVLLKNCDIKFVSLNASKIDVQTSQIRFGVVLTDNSEMNADALYLAETEPNYFALMAHCLVFSHYKCQKERPLRRFLVVN